MMPELVYELIHQETPTVRRILDECVILLVPSLNPSGLELVAAWYERTLGTKAEGTPPPELDHPYAGHDNNRDWFMLTQPETRWAVEFVHNRWRPHIVADLHQMQANGPRFVLPPFADPIDDNVDPLLQAEGAALGACIAGEMTGMGLTGIATSVIFDAYSPSRAYQHYHGGVRILAEAASARIASPIELRVDQLVETRGLWPSERSANQPLPWPGGTWSLRDIIDYHKAAVMAMLDQAARQRERWITNMLRIQERALQPCRPYAFIIPGDDKQRDPHAACELLDVLQFGDVEIEEAVVPFESCGEAFPRGTRVIRLAQPFGRYAKTLLEVQHYPVQPRGSGSPRPVPYDITAHTLPLLMGVDAIAVDQPFNATLRRLDRIEYPRGGLIGLHHPAAVMLGAESNAAYRMAIRLLAAGHSVTRLASPETCAGRSWPAGTFLIPATDPELIKQLAIEERVEAIGIVTLPAAPKAPIRMPRIGLYRAWRHTAHDEGWTRFVLETYRVPFTTVRDDDMRSGTIRELVDVLVLPHLSTKELAEGNDPDVYPAEFASGLGQEGLEQIRGFVNEGGTVITLDGPSNLMIRALDLPIVNCLDSVDLEHFSCPGAILRVQVDGNHPLGWGYERDAAVMMVGSPAFDGCQADPARVTTPVTYHATDHLLSGWIMGAELLAGKAALVDVRVGSGRAILFGFRPQFRAQARGTYRFLFNALLYPHVNNA